MNKEACEEMKRLLLEGLAKLKVECIDNLPEAY